MTETKKPTMKQAKEVAARYGMKIRKDVEWNDIIVTLPDGTKASFYDDLADAIDTMEFIGQKAGTK